MRVGEEAVGEVQQQDETAGSGQTADAEASAVSSGKLLTLKSGALTWM
jgi:hypothetical protein